jgi:hypothetical protein
MGELVVESNLREAGRLIGRGREMVRRFVSGDIAMPHDRTREAIARLYVQRYGRNAWRAAENPSPRGTSMPLKLILPTGVERATAELRAIFEALRRYGDEMPPSAVALERWLVRRIKDEYANESPYPRPRKRRAPAADAPAEPTPDPPAGA